MVAHSDIEFDRAPAALPADAGQLGLGDLVGIVLRRKRLVTATAVLGLVLAGGYLAVQQPIYRPTVEVFIDPQTPQVVGKDLLPPAAASIDLANVDSQPYVILSATVLDKVARQLDLANRPAFQSRGLTRSLLGGGGQASVEQAVEVLRDRLTVKRVDNSFVFQITASFSDPKLAAEIANEVAKAYLAQAIDQRSEAATRTGASLTAQAADMRAQLDRAEKAVEKFKADNGLISIGENGLVVTQQLRDLYAQISLANGEVARLQARGDQVKKIGRADLDAGALPEAALSPTVTQLRAQYARIVQEEARLGETLGASHPQIAQLRSQRDTLSRLLADEIQRIDRGIRVDLDRAKANLANLEQRAREVAQANNAAGDAQVKLRSLEAEAEAIRSVYTAFLGRAKELDQQRRIQANNSRIITLATPPERSAAPPKGMVLLAAGFFGAVVGVAGAVALDLLGGIVARPSAAAALLGTRLLAVLPRPARGARPAADGRNGPGAPADRAATADRIAAIPLAQALRERFRGMMPATVMIVHANGAGATKVVAERTARTLADLGEGVVLCTLDRQSPARTAWRRIVGAETGGFEPRMEVRRIGMAGRFGSGGLPDRADRRRRHLTLAETVETISDEFILFDAGDADPGLAGLIDCVDAIVLVAETGRTTRRDLERTAMLIEPWRRRVVGLVMVGKAA